jgi:hypothetical protein
MCQSIEAREINNIEMALYSHGPELPSFNYQQSWGATPEEALCNLQTKLQHYGQIICPNGSDQAASSNRFSNWRGSYILIYNERRSIQFSPSTMGGWLAGVDIKDHSCMIA